LAATTTTTAAVILVSFQNAIAIILNPVEEVDVIEAAECETAVMIVTT
jgi:hypothetical protein